MRGLSKKEGFKMNKGLRKLWELGRNSVIDLIGQVGATKQEIVGDFKEMQSQFKEKIDLLLKEWTEDETIYLFFEGFFKSSEKGVDAAVQYLRQTNDKLQKYLEQQVRLTPHLVGSVDGFLSVYLATSAMRWVRSPRYRMGVKTGRVIGVICAFTIFLPVSVGRAVICALPGISRMAKYFTKQWKVAKEKRTRG